MNADNEFGISCFQCHDKKQQSAPNWPQYWARLSTRSGSKVDSSMPASRIRIKSYLKCQYVPSHLHWYRARDINAESSRAKHGEQARISLKWIRVTTSLSHQPWAPLLVCGARRRLYVKATAWLTGASTEIWHSSCSAINQIFRDGNAH